MPTELKEQNTLQQSIFNAVINQHSSKSEAVDALVKLLAIGKSSLYRKINNQSSLKPNEIVLIAEQYNFSLDEMIYGSNNRYLFNHVSGLFDFLNNEYAASIHNLQAIAAQKGQATIHYSGAEFPIFHLCHYPEIIHFKKCMMSRINQPNSATKYQLINFDEITRQEREFYLEIAQLYEQLPSVELWDSLALAPIIEQIRYSYEIGILEADDVEMLIGLLNRLLNRLEKMLQNGSKSFDADNRNFEAYHNLIPSANWIYIVKGPSIQFVQSVLDSPNVLSSSSLRLVDSVLEGFQAYRRQSQLISAAGEIQRNQLFNNYRQYLDRFSRRFEDMAF